MPGTIFCSKLTGELCSGIIDACLCIWHSLNHILSLYSPLGQGSDELLEHPVVKKVAESTGKSAAQVVLQWNLQQGCAVAAKCSSEEHMREVLAVRSSDGLSGEHMKVLNELGEKKRFVDPPFMFGSAPYCWGKQRPSN